MIDLRDYLISNAVELNASNSQLKNQYKRQLDKMPSFYDDIVSEYINVIKRQIINDYCKLTGRQYDLVDVELEEIDLKGLFW